MHSVAGWSSHRCLFFFLFRFLLFFLFDSNCIVHFVLSSDSLFFIFFIFLDVCNKNWIGLIGFDIDAIPSHARYRDTTSSTRRYFVRVILHFFFLHHLRLFKCIIGLLWRERRPDQHSPVHRQSPRNIDICIYRRSSVDRTGRALN